MCVLCELRAVRKRLPFMMSNYRNFLCYVFPLRITLFSASSCVVVAFSFHFPQVFFLFSFSFDFISVLGSVCCFVQLRGISRKIYILC